MATPTRARDIVDALARADQLAGPAPDLPAIAGVAEDSRLVRPGWLFCAISGTVQDGHRFLADAAQRGAAAALVTHRADVALPQLIVRDGRAAAAIAAGAWFGAPASAMRLVGVTGTNGKSTTVALIRHLMNANGDAGTIGTLGAFDGSGEPLAEANLTTPGPVELQKILADLRDRHTKFVVMETSSHALHQRRVVGLMFAAAVYTNLTLDHLDYHGDMDGYLAAKMLLSAQLKPDGAEIINVDDPAWTALPERKSGRRVTFGFGPTADVRATDIALEARQSRFTLTWGTRRLSAEIPLVGEFNVANATGSAAAAWALGMDLSEIVDRLRSAPQVSGRMERLADDGFVVLRDFAHTPDALDRVIRTLRPITRGRLIVLFGCGGDRDRKKRPVMGRIAARNADIAIVTSDNPRTEDPDRIIDDVEAGMEGKAHIRVTDRREAIHRALGLLETGDCLVLAGKGHETYQVVGTEKQAFDEKEIVGEMLGQRGREGQ